MLEQTHKIKQYLLLFSLLLLGNQYLMAQSSVKMIVDSTAIKYAETITAKDLKTYLSKLASDEFEGRETGKPGQRKAAQYIADHFKSLDCPPIDKAGKSYFQPFSLDKQKLKDVSFKVDNKSYKFLEDFYCFSGGSTAMEYKAEDIVFAGYGIEDKKYNDYAKGKGKNIKGKIVMALVGEPMRKDSTFVLTGTTEPSEWSQSWRKKLSHASEKGAKAMLIIVADVANDVKKFGNYIKQGRMELKGKGGKSKSMQTFYISREMAQDILGTKKRNQISRFVKKVSKKGKARKTILQKAAITAEVIKEGELIPTENVVGYIEGSDPKLKNELLFITAHYDHLGKEGDKIFNGADDDGSGTSSVMEIAQAFALAKKDGKGPRRSVVVMTVSGEEKGLLGSRYFTDIDPIYPLKDIIADLNVDMVGRIGEEYIDKDPNYLYIIGSDKLSSELHEISEKSNQLYTKLKLDYKYNDDNDPNRFYYRSDHYNFAKNNIPIIFYFNGVHADYHQASDTVDKIEFDVLEKRSRLVFHTAWQLANQDKRISVDKKPKKQK